MFQGEQALLGAAYEKRQKWLMGLAVGAIAGITLPICLDLSRPLKGALLMLGFGSGIGISVTALNGLNNQKYWDAVQRAQEEYTENAIAAEAYRWQVAQQIESTAEVMALLEQVPAALQYHFAEQLGLTIPMGFEVPECFEGYSQTIPVQSAPVREALPEDGAIATYQSPGIATLDRDSLPSVSVQYDVESTPFDKPRDPDPFPTEDLAQLVAHKSTSIEDCGTVLIACPKGTGKSNLLNACIAAIAHRTNGRFDPYIFNGKELEKGKNFCGIEKYSDRYILTNSANMDAVLARMHRLNNICLNQDDPKHPTLIISDEWNKSLMDAQTHDLLIERKQDRVSPMLKTMDYEQIIQGRSKLVPRLITSHSPLVQDIGQNTQIQTSLDTIVLARGNKTEAIFKALERSHPIPNTKLRQQLSDAFMAYVNSSQFDPNRVVALTNLGGQWRLCFLPRYPDQQPTLNINQPSLLSNAYVKPQDDNDDEGDVWDIPTTELDEAIAQANHGLNETTQLWVRGGGVRGL